MPPRIKTVDPHLVFATSLHLVSSTFFISGEVDDKMSDQVAKSLHILDQLDTEEPVRIYLNTPGGDRTEGLAIYDLIRHAQRRVRIIGYGQVSSMGSIILQAADQRDLTSNCHVMLHPGWMNNPSEEHEEQHEAVVKIYRQERDRGLKIVADRMGISLKEFLRRYRWDTSLSPTEAVKLGLADRVL